MMPIDNVLLCRDIDHLTHHSISSPASQGDTMLPHRDDHAGIIREVRTRLGLTQEEFAVRLGVTLPTINRWENGRASPSPLAMRGLRELVHHIGDEGKDLVQWFASGGEPE